MKRLAFIAALLFATQAHAQLVGMATQSGTILIPLTSASGALNVNTTVGGVVVSTTNPLPITEVVGTPITATSGNVANASAVATLPGAVGKTTYITDFECTASGATGALVVNLAITGTISGGQTYTFVFPAGVTTAAQPLLVTFPTPIPASATNTAIVVTLPAGGTGNTNAACNAQGYQQ